MARARRSPHAGSPRRRQAPASPQRPAVSGPAARCEAGVLAAAMMIMLWFRPGCAAPEARALARYRWWPRRICSSRPSALFMQRARCRIGAARARPGACWPARLPDLPPSSTAPFIRRLSRLDGAAIEQRYASSPGQGTSAAPPASCPAAQLPCLPSPGACVGARAAVCVCARAAEAALAAPRRWWRW